VRYIAANVLSRPVEPRKKERKEVNETLLKSNKEKNGVRV
jgi:hypothetical protein